MKKLFILILLLIGMVLPATAQTTWTSRTSAADNQWFGVTYGNGLFVAVAASGTGNRVMTSGSLNTITNVPTLSEWGYIGLTGLLLALAVYQMRRRAQEI